MAEIVIGRDGDTLQALGLGSCIGLLMVDRSRHIGGLAHIMLPSSSIAGKGDFPAGKYADTGVRELLRLLLAAGAERHRLQVKMAGGAEMFSMPGGTEPRLGVGQRNIQAVEAELRQLGLRLEASEVGGNCGRTLELELSSLQSSLRRAGSPPRDF